MRDAIISIRPEYVKKFISGEKTVELRSRRVNLAPGARLWIYTTLPKGRFEVLAVVDNVVSDSPEEIWERFGIYMAISEETFRHYVNGSKCVSAIVTKSIHQFPIDINLSDLKSQVPDFHPPQFVKYLTETDPLSIELEKHLNSCLKG